ncbi:3-oxoacyl-ACP synthase [Paraburkholderia kururiensis]|uniref:3-oxoacyl-ACP synthase n=1 Tax=Paraburkholderia kururiensis TaxID=984307 RepID=UPI0039A5D0EC
MKVRIGISHAAYFLPEQIDDVRSWAGRTGHPAATVARLEQRGVRYFREAGNQTAFSLAAQAIGTLVDACALAPDTIDALVYVHTLQGSIAPPPFSLPGLLCERFGFECADAFSFAQQHCASSLGALRVIRAMFAARPAMKRVLLVGADVMPLDADRLMEAGGILSDGACAVLIERDAGANHLLSLAFHATGDGWRGALDGDEPHVAAQSFLVARQLIKQVTRNVGIPVSGIQRILPSHLDLPAWHRVIASLGLPPTCLFADNFARIGHTTVSDPFIDLLDCNDLVPGKPFLLYARGVGGFSAAALFMR